LQQKKVTSRSHERTTALLSTHENSFDFYIFGGSSPAAELVASDYRSHNLSF